MMKIEILRIIGKIFLIACVSTMSLHAVHSKKNITNMGIQTKVQKVVDDVTIYNSMSTAQLQYEVERLSTNGVMSFEMGIELMQRWSKG